MVVGSHDDFPGVEISIAGGVGEMVRERVDAATRLEYRDFDKCEFLDEINSIRQQTFKLSTVQSAFQATGLIPYNPEVVISKLR